MSRAKNEDRFDADERVRGDAYAVPRTTRRRKFWMLVYPRQKRATIKPGWNSVFRTDPIDELLMTSSERNAILRILSARERRGLRIVEVPL